MPHKMRLSPPVRDLRADKCRSFHAQRRPAHFPRGRFMTTHCRGYNRAADSTQAACLDDLPSRSLPAPAAEGAAYRGASPTPVLAPATRRAGADHRRHGRGPRAPRRSLRPARCLRRDIPPEALVKPSQRQLLGWTFGISVAIHAIVLSIHFAPKVVKDFGRGPPLEVALVNAKTKEKPVKAEVLAQANLDGGGNTDRTGARSRRCRCCRKTARKTRSPSPRRSSRTSSEDEGDADGDAGERNRLRSRRRRRRRPSGPNCRRATR